MKTVLTYGTFDLFHVGHVRLLKRIAAYGDRLIVACSSDEFNAIKGKKSILSYEDRAEILKSCRYVHEVIPENHWEQKIDDVKKYNVDIFAMGDDWAGKFDFLQDHTEVIYLPRTEGIPTTQIKDVVAAINDEKNATVERRRAPYNAFEGRLEHDNKASDLSAGTADRPRWGDDEGPQIQQQH